MADSALAGTILARGDFGLDDDILSAFKKTSTERQRPTWVAPEKRMVSSQGPNVGMDLLGSLVLILIGTFRGERPVKCQPLANTSYIPGCQCPSQAPLPPQ